MEFCQIAHIGNASLTSFRHMCWRFVLFIFTEPHNWRYMCLRSKRSVLHIVVSGSGCHCLWLWLRCRNAIAQLPKPLFQGTAYACAYIGLFPQLFLLENDAGVHAGALIRASAYLGCARSSPILLQLHGRGTAVVSRARGQVAHRKSVSLNALH